CDTWQCIASSRALYWGVCPDSASVTPGPAEHPPEHCTAECVLTQLCDTWLQSILQSTCDTWPCRASSRALYCGVCPDSASVTPGCIASSRALYWECVLTQLV
ncbi:hypothetical protein KUCAC02_033396, partial [Chaenocephalus aceratus]